MTLEPPTTLTFPDVSVHHGPVKRFTRKRCLVHNPSHLSFIPQHTQYIQTRAHMHVDTHKCTWYMPIRTSTHHWHAQYGALHWKRVRCSNLSKVGCEAQQDRRLQTQVSTYVSTGLQDHGLCRAGIFFLRSCPVAVAHFAAHCQLELNNSRCDKLP